MIKIDDKLIDHLSKLSRLEVADREKLKVDLQKIIDYFEILKEIDTSNTEPMYTPVECPASLRGIEVEKSEPTKFEAVDEIIENFPDRHGRFVKVPGIYS